MLKNKKKFLPKLIKFTKYSESSISKDVEEGSAADQTDICHSCRGLDQSW